MFLFNIQIGESYCCCEQKIKEKKPPSWKFLKKFSRIFPEEVFFAIKVSIILNNRLLEQDIKTHNKTNKTMLLTL